MNETSQTSRAALLFPVISILIGLVAGVLIIEAGLRILDVVPTQKLTSVDEYEYRTLPGFWSPNQDLISLDKATLPYRVKTNSLGYRGADFPLEKPPGELRLVMTGDSYTFGIFVDDEQTFPALLEAELRRRCSNSGVRVVNAGLPGATIHGEDEIIKRSLALEPDLVILTFHENDLFDLKSPIWLSMAENRRIKSGFPLRFVWPVVRETAIWNFLLHWRRMEQARDYRPPAPDANADAAVEAAYVAEQAVLRAQYKSRLDEVRELLDESGIAFAFVTFPGPAAVRGGRDAEIVDWAAQAGHDAGVPTTNLLPTLRGSLSKVEDGYLLPRDDHPSAVVHGIAARALSEDLSKLDALKDKCGEARSARH